MRICNLCYFDNYIYILFVVQLTEFLLQEFSRSLVVSLAVTIRSPKTILAKRTKPKGLAVRK